jgi:hypothetical protein
MMRLSFSMMSTGAFLRREYAVPTACFESWVDRSLPSTAGRSRACLPSMHLYSHLAHAFRPYNDAIPALSLRA